MKSNVLLMVTVLLSLTGAGCGNSGPGESDGAETEKTAPVRVQAATVERTTLRPALDLVGTLVPVPEQTAVISPQLGGWVQSLDVREGEHIQTGQALVHLDTRTARINIQRAQAVVAEKEATLKRLKRGYLPDEIQGARDDRDQAQAKVDGLRSELQALEDLLKRREISPVIYETKSKALHAAEAAMASADSRLKLLEAGTPTEEIEGADAMLNAARADLEQAELSLQWCTITSPIDGVVVQLLARRGQYFDRAVPLATVMDLSKILVQLRIPGRAFASVPLETKVDVRFDSIPGQAFHGTISRISGEADPLTGNVNMFATVENTQGNLRPGLACHAHVWLSEIPDALVVPAVAVADHSGTPVVTLIRNGEAHETVVELGAQTLQLVQVTEGLSAGDLVATAGGYGLPDGCPVRVVDDLAAVRASVR